MKDYLTFRKLITPKLIQILFWSLVVLIVLKAIEVMIDFDALAGLFILIAGPVAARVICEIILLVFRIQRLLLDIKFRLEPKVGTAPR